MDGRSFGIRAQLPLFIVAIKEKVLAARRAELTRIIMPRQNEADLHDLPDDVRSETEFIFVDHIDDVLRAAIPEACRAEKAS